MRGSLSPHHGQRHGPSERVRGSSAKPANQMEAWRGFDVETEPGLRRGRAFSEVRLAWVRRVENSGILDKKAQQGLGRKAPKTPVFVA